MEDWEKERAREQLRDAERERGGGLEFNFDEAPKTGLVFEETDDAEAPYFDDEEATFVETEEKTEESVAVKEELPSAEEPMGCESQSKTVPEEKIRSVDDEEFEIPDTFDERGASFDGYVSTIWKTYVPRFTEVTDNYNYIADNSLAQKSVSAQRIDSGNDPAPSTEGAANRTVSVKVEQLTALADVDESDPTAELDHDIDQAVVVNVGSGTDSAIENDTINVFKFPTEGEGKVKEEETEEDRTRRNIAELTGHKWQTDDGNAEEPSSSETVDESSPEVLDTENETEEKSAFSTDAWSDTVPDSEKLSEVYAADDSAEAEEETPKNVSNKKVSASDTSEYNSFATRDVFKDRFLDTTMAVKLRLIVAVLLGAFTLVFENLYLFGVQLFEGASVSHGVIDACLICALFLIALPEAVRGLKAFLRGVLAPEFSSALSVILLLVYTLVMAITAPAEVSYPLFGFVATILSVNSVIASYCIYYADFAAFKMISDKGIKHVYDTMLTRDMERENLALDGAIDEYKSKTARSFDAGFISDFVKNSSRRYENTKNNAIVLAVTLGVAIVAGAVMLFVGENGAVSGFSSFALVIALASPAFAVMSHKLPFANAEREAIFEGGAIIGERTMYDFAGVDVVAFEDTEVFGTDDVSFKSISLSDGRTDFDDAMRKMSSLFTALGGPLSNVFAKTLNKKYSAAENVVIEDDGAEGLIDGKRVMAGTFDYMQRHGVRTPMRTEPSLGSTKIMYAAEEGEIFAKFTVNYAFSEEFALMLSAMREKGIVPLIYTRDFNISNEFLRFLTSGADVIRVMRRYTPERPKKVFGKISASFVTLKDKTSAVNMLMIARKYSAFQSRLAVTEMLAASVGATLAVVIALCNMTSALPSILLGGWQIIWTAVLAIISVGTFNKRNKDDLK